MTNQRLLYRNDALVHISPPSVEIGIFSTDTLSGSENSSSLVSALAIFPFSFVGSVFPSARTGIYCPILLREHKGNQRENQHKHASECKGPCFSFSFFASCISLSFYNDYLIDILYILENIITASKIYSSYTLIHKPSTRIVSIYFFTICKQQFQLFAQTAV